MESKSLANKTVLVLGGSAGIGLAAAKAAAESGASVIIVSSNTQRIDNALKELPEGSKGIAADLSKEENFIKVFEQAGSFDHLVYTAGENLSVGNIDTADIEKAKLFFNVRYWGAYTAVKYGSQKINKGGSITLTGGSAAHRSGAGWTIAASICGAIESLTRALAVELAPIRVNCVVPGFVKTDLWSGINEADRESMFAAAAEKLPVKHIAEPGEIAEAYLYLLKQTYGTGQSIIVDGGGLLV